jgi:hypothetical protein
VHVERLMRALAVELLAEAIKFALLSSSSAGWRACGFCFQSAMHAFMAAVLVGFARLDELGEVPRRIHQAESRESLPRVLVAKGTPLSVRMR